MDSIDVRTLQVPKSSLGQVDIDLLKSDGTAIRQWPKSPFPIDEDINSLVILYDGDIELLRAEALVNPTNENLNELSYVSKLAGPELETFIRDKRVRPCPTGDVRVTPGFGANYKFIIHAVPPKYQPKYKTACETALYLTYFRILETMIEKRIRTVVMPTLVTPKCNLPFKDNCNLQLRIIRRMLEKKRHEFDRIVIHVKNIDTCSTPFYCYYPQGPIDEEMACYHFVGSLGGANGQPIIPEREIRIKSKPAATLDQNDNSIDLRSGLDLSTVVGQTAFSKMREDLDSMNDTAQGHAKPTLSSSRSLGKYLARRKSVQVPGRHNKLAVQKRSVLTGCNLF